MDGKDGVGGEKMLHVLNADDVILDGREWEWEQQRGQGEIEG